MTGCCPSGQSLEISAPELRDFSCAELCCTFLLIKGMSEKVELIFFCWHIPKTDGNKREQETTMEGRMQFDLLQVMQRDYKLSSAHFLGKQRERCSSFNYIGFAQWKCKN